MVSAKTVSSHELPEHADLIEIIYYTDPLCCWSWGFEPQWRRLLYEYSGKIKFRYCMGGLLPGWKNFHDAVNAVSKPVQMGPVWMHAAQLSGMPVNHNVWVKDAPTSSYPACIAVKCAGLQSKQVEDIYLRALRESVMINGENISKLDILIKAAKRVEAIHPSFDMRVFMEDLESDRGKEAFRKDLQEVQYLHITRFPSLVLKNKSKQGVIISGYRDYSSLIDAVRQIADLEKTHKIIDIDAYKDYWHFTTDREVVEVQEKI